MKRKKSNNIIFIVVYYIFDCFLLEYLFDTHTISNSHTTLNIIIGTRGSKIKQTSKGKFRMDKVNSHLLEYSKFSTGHPGSQFVFPQTDHSQLSSMIPSFGIQKL